MPVIDIKAFAGCIKKLNPRLIEKHQSVDCRNLFLDTGGFVPLQGNSDVLSVPDGTKSIYLFNQNTWLHWEVDVNVCKGPIAGDTTERTYFTFENSYPKVGDVSTLGSGVYYRLGVPAPENSPSLTVNNPITQEPESRAYVYTFVTAWGEESAPSPPSGVEDVYEGQTVTVGTEAPPTGDYNFSLKRYYRTVTTSSGTYWMYVGESDVSVTSWVDDKTTTELGEVLQTGNWDMPPEDLHGLISLPNGLMAGFSKNELCFCVPYQPHAWPVDYRYSMDHDIVAIGAISQDVVVTTSENPYLVTGIDPGGMTKAKLALNQSCSSKRSLVSMGYGVIYASPDGLIMIGGSSGAKNITENILTREQWQELNPSSMIGLQHDGKYYGFYDNGVPGGFIIDTSGSFEFLDYHAFGGYNHLEEDKLFAVFDNGTDYIIRHIEGDTVNQLTGSWSSKIFSLVHPVNMCCLMLWSEQPCMVNIVADGQSIFNQSVNGYELIRLPAGFLASDWQVELKGSDVVIHRVLMATSVDELRAAM